MTQEDARYACITPARDEADNLPRLARSLAVQECVPWRWLIVDNGSRDDTRAVAAELAREHDWISVLDVEGADAPVRGSPIVRALHAGFAALGELPPVVVNLDADVSMEPDYFARLLAAFAADPSLGIASGSCWEQEGGVWRQRFVTGSTVWGASRAWRRECLEQVLPLEERLGWDGIDEFKANARGWTTRTLLDLPFRHHRREGQRDSASWRTRTIPGRTARYVGYRPWYLVLRAIFQARRDWRSLAWIWGYAAAALEREPRCPDGAARAYVRHQQGLRQLPLRAREALGRRGTSPPRPT